MTKDSIGKLLEPYVDFPGMSGEVWSEGGIDWPDIQGKLLIYLELILKWNARINLTSIREPEEIIRRHFGESLFVGCHLGKCERLLDFGSGAGFPGIPMQLLRPDMRVTLAESQRKKAAFLSEVVRDLNLQTEVWYDRVEAMPAERQFDVVAMRAVDRMERALAEAARRARERVLIAGPAGGSYSGPLKDFRMAEAVPLPGLSSGALWIAKRIQSKGVLLTPLFHVEQS